MSGGPAVAPDLSAVVRLAREQFRAGAGAVLDVLLRTPGITTGWLTEALPRQAGVQVLLEAGPLQPAFEELDRATAAAWRCVLLRTGAQGSAAVLAAEDPWDDALLQRVARRIGRQPQPMAVRRALLQGWLGEAAASEPATAGGTTGAAGPIVAFVDQALRAAFDNGASDVHFECDRGGVSAKHRLDGVLTPFARLDGAQRAQETISRIKVLAKLDITERRLPQDGRFRFDFGAAQVDPRVSIMPSVHGEDAVLRLLDKARLRDHDRSASLDALGFDAAAAATIRELAGLPSGMLLVTGPTGSGKTTTLYAVLSEINTGLEKIVTIEDPVEYELAGVLQIPVNERKGLTFARGLRSILRHDPDRILVGEIRDAETAEIAVQSALTGHLVFTTVHANSMADIVGRFRHFGLDMFGFMSSLNGVVVQRLLRQLCPRCVGERPATDSERAWLDRAGLAGCERLAHPQGCADCHGTGYKGRFVLAEVHGIDDELRDQVTGGAPLMQLKAHAAAQGVVPLWQQAARQVVLGRTSAEEVKRVVGWS
jgi:general secretion pathway protein E